MKANFMFYLIALYLVSFNPLGAQTDVELERTATTEDLQTPVEPDVLAGQSFLSRVVDVISGETFTMNTPENTVVEVWLAEVEAPSYGQLHWAASTQALSDKLAGQDVTVTVISQRGVEEGKPHLIAQVFVGDRWINKEMVAEGMAWHFPEYLNSAELTSAEQQAKEMKLGIWEE